MKAERRLLPIVLVYLPVAVLGAILSFRYDVGATPTGRAATDLPFRGSPLAPPLFLPLLLTAGAVLARRGGRAGTVGTVFCGLVGLAFLGGSTLNVPNDLEAAEAAGSPRGLTIALAVVHFGLALGLISHALLGLRSRRKRAGL